MVLPLFTSRLIKACSVMSCDFSTQVSSVLRREGMFARRIIFEIRNLQFHIGHAVAQMGKPLYYKPEGHGFDSRLGPLCFRLPQNYCCTMSLRSPHPLAEMNTRIFPRVDAGGV